MIKACRDNDVNKVKELLKGPCKYINAMGHSPLSVAIQYFHNAIVELLLAHPNIKVNRQGLYEGQPPLVFACQHKNIVAVQLLLGHKDININTRSLFGPSAFDFVVTRLPYNYMCVFIDRGVEISEINPEWPEARKNFLQICRLPWNRFNTAKYYPKEFNAIAFAWLLCAKRLGVCKDLRLYMIPFLAENWKLIK